MRKSVKDLLDCKTKNLCRRGQIVNEFLEMRLAHYDALMSARLEQYRDCDDPPVSPNHATDI